MAQVPLVEEGYELTADLAEEFAAASNPAFPTVETVALGLMPGEQLMTQERQAFHELRSVHVLSYADTEPLDSLQQELTTLRNEQVFSSDDADTDSLESVQRWIEMPAGLRDQCLPNPPLFLPRPLRTPSAHGHNVWWLMILCQFEEKKRTLPNVLRRSFSKHSIEY